MWIWWFLIAFMVSSSSAKPPHIVFIVADDLGWNDLSYHGSNEIPTPNIDALAFNGVILNRHYALPVCTPSRAALMTGKYPIHLGMQGAPMYAAEPRGLPPGKLLPQYLKDLGYTTRAIGKWHLGFYKKEFTPVFRGFDSHLGFWAGSLSYYDHIVQDLYPDGHILQGHDFRRNMTTAWDLDGQYATDVFTKEAVDIISNHPKNTPLFLYMGHLAVHTGNVGKPLEAPQQEIDKFRHIPEPNRRTYAAMVSKLDESVGEVTKALQRRDMLQDSIIIFISDNGAPTVNIFSNWGSNYPLRGIKATLWEGGVRVNGFIWSPLIKNPHRVSNELMHITDWLPTLFSAAGGNSSQIPSDVDGKNQWNAIAGNETSARRDILVNIDEVAKTAAFIEGEWKLVVGTSGINGSLDGYFGDSGTEYTNPAYDLSTIKKSSAWQSISRYPTVSEKEFQDLRDKATVKCNTDTKHRTSNCNPSQTKIPCLFHIPTDPCETNNLVSKYESIARRMYSSLAKSKKTLVKQLNTKWDFSGADPRKFNNTWSPWLD